MLEIEYKNGNIRIYNFQKMEIIGDMYIKVRYSYGSDCKEDVIDTLNVSHIHINGRELIL